MHTVRTRLGGMPVILLATALIYARGLGVYFAADDFRYLEMIRRVRSLGDMAPFLQGTCTRFERPVTVLVFWVSQALGGDSLSVHHLLLLALHLANVILTFGLARRVMGGKATLAPVLAALIVALHPRQHESVMGLSAVSWPAGTLLSLLTAHFYLWWRDRRGLLPAAATLVATALASFSNPAAVVMPVVVLSYDALQRTLDKRRLAFCALLGAAAAVPALACGVGGIVETSVAGYGLSFKEAATQLPLYAAMTWWTPLLHLKTLLQASLLAFVAVMLATALGALGVVIYLLRRGTVMARWGVIWAGLGILAPALFANMLWDRYMSLMLVGIALLVAGVVESLGQRWQRPALAAAVLWAGLALAQTWVKLDQWQAVGEITSDVRNTLMERYPTVPPRSSFFLIGLPATQNDIMVWHCCVNNAVRVWYNDQTLTARQPEEHGIVSRATRNDLIVDFADRGWEQKK